MSTTANQTGTSGHRGEARGAAGARVAAVVGGTILWVVTVRYAAGMGVGVGTMGMAFPPFVGMWVAMMGAMMLPAIAPASAGSVNATTGTRTRSRGLLIAAHVVGFFVPWALFGMAAFLALLGIGWLVDAAPAVARWLGVGIFALAGLYQLSPAKHACLHHCRMRMPQAGVGMEAAVRTGVVHGSYCVGCCWALMSILFAVGVMSIPAMIGLAALISVEKVSRFGAVVARVAGLAFLGVAAVAAFDPSLLGGLVPAAASMMTGGGM